MSGFQLLPTPLLGLSPKTLIYNQFDICEAFFFLTTEALTVHLYVTHLFFIIERKPEGQIYVKRL